MLAFIIVALIMVSLHRNRAPITTACFILFYIDTRISQVAIIPVTCVLHVLSNAPWQTIFALLIINMLHGRVETD